MCNETSIQSRTKMQTTLLVLVLLASQASFLAARTPTVCGVDEQHQAAIEALNEAVKRTGADPIEIIRLGEEKIKEKYQQQLVGPRTTQTHPALVEDDDDHDLGLSSLFDERNHEQKREEPVQRRPAAVDHHDDGDMGLKSLFSENHITHSSHHSHTSTNWQKSYKNVYQIDKDQDFGLRNLFKEDEPKKSPVENLPKLSESTSPRSDNELSADQFARALDVSTANSSASLFDDDDDDDDQLEQKPMPQNQDLKLPEAVPEPKHDHESKLPEENNNKPAEGLKLPEVNTTAPIQEPAPGDGNVPPPAQQRNDSGQPDENRKPGQPIEEHFVDSYIDNSDPNDPKKVQVERQIKSHVDPTGAVSHSQAETRTSTSLNTGGDKASKQHYSKHSSHSSSSYSSSYASSNQNKPAANNWNKNGKKNQKQVPSGYPSMPQTPTSIPPLAPVVFMPMLPYGSQPTWPGFYNPNQKMSKKQQQQIQQQQLFQQLPFASAFASAGAGASARAGSGFAGASAFAGAPAMPFYGAAPGFQPAAKATGRKGRNARRKERRRAEQMAAMQNQ